MLADLLLADGRNLKGFVDLEASESGKTLFGLPVLGDESWLANKVRPKDVYLVNGIGMTGCCQRRQNSQVQLMKNGWRFTSCVHPSAIIGANVDLSNGVQVMAGVVIQSGSSIAEAAIVNTRASIDHDCVIEEYAHVAPGAILAGGVRVEAGAHIGMGACLIQNVSVGRRAIVGAGAVVIKDVSAKSVVVGVPASSKCAP